ncbi:MULTISPECIES: NifB/NifX family molybdenum-iron cluster-binding protein [Aeromonas]|uniref:Dinitrogenase iron-molybdenum cofactor biosynthesis domain-containing protein n=1 Tax=Aeromonas schubertii TaxID=652 RepID=A0A0S2SCX6_9GAMM|nr:MULTISPECIES: NifB/NifX family molybdenum-iron cluster-binding protein [Aeromonas]ALP39547.1 hypothetical protein WL1483_128 [Aeromonas schubertii]KUE79315.1 hypothetical protein ATO46_18770 [Aeromonas schubertii]
MLIAIPVENDRFIPHVARAPIFWLQDASGKRLGYLDAPAGGCKGPLPGSLRQQGVTHLVVRRIGEQMLARMQAAGIDVVYAERGWQPGQPLPSASLTRSDSTRQPAAIVRIRGRS